MTAMAMNQIFEDWDDDERMRALFACFRPKNVNPEGWRNKMNTWMSVISAWCKRKRRVVMSAKELISACERKGEYPHCLEQVLLHMTREGTLTQIENAGNYSTNIGWISWSVDLLVKKPVSWGWRTISNYINGNTDAASVQKYVHMPLLKEVSASVLQKIESEVDFDTPMISFSKCKSVCKEVCDEESFSLAVSHLQGQQKITVFTESGTQYIKLHGRSEEKTTVTETDVGFIKLQKALQKVDSELDKLREDIQSITDQAKQAMRAGQKTKVKQLLRRRKQLENTVEVKMKTAEQLDGMIHKLQSSSSNQEVIGALKAGLTAQKKMAAVGFNIDAVEDTMADINDIYSEQAEIEQAMASPGFLNDEGSDSALEQELDDLLEEHVKSQKLVQPAKGDTSPKGASFPEVPTTNPSPQKFGFIRLPPQIPLPDEM